MPLRGVGIVRLVSSAAIARPGRFRNSASTGRRRSACWWWSRRVRSASLLRSDECGHFTPALSRQKAGAPETHPELLSRLDL
jgi:hypothetical protein